MTDKIVPGTSRRSVIWMLTILVIFCAFMVLETAEAAADAVTPGYGVVTVIYENEKTGEELKTVTGGLMAVGEMRGFDLSDVDMEEYSINAEIFQAYPGQEDLKISQSNGIWTIQVPVVEGTRIVYVPYTKRGEIPLQRPRDVSNPNEELIRSEIRVWLYNADTGIMITTIPFSHEGVRGGKTDFLPADHGYEFAGIKPYSDTTDVRQIPGGIQIDVNKLSYVIEILVNENGDAAVPEAGTTTGTTPAASPVQKMASPTVSKIYVDGVETAFDAYSISDNNYFKLRDLAYVLGDVFDVGYEDGNVTLISGKAYTITGQEMSAGDGASKTAESSPDKIYLNGSELVLEVYKIGGSNYFKLRDLALALDFGVEWRDNAVQIDSNTSYTPS